MYLPYLLNIIFYVTYLPIYLIIVCYLPTYNMYLLPSTSYLPSTMAQQVIYLLIQHCTTYLSLCTFNTAQPFNF
jgi:hypothetical protein